MLMKVRQELEPLARLRAAVPDHFHPVLELLIGAVAVPTDQPSCATAVGTLSQCLTAYGRWIEFTRPEFKAWLNAAKCISDLVLENTVLIQGLPPESQIDGRKVIYPGWALLLAICDEHQPLRTALGAEIALSMLEQRQLNVSFCNQLRLDIKKYGRPQNGKEPGIDDLAYLGFGKAWLTRFNKIDARVRRLVEVHGPHGPDRPDHIKPANRFDLLARLRWRLEFPNGKHRQCAIDDSHLTVSQHIEVCSAVRKRCDCDDDAGIVEAVCIFSGLTPNLTKSMPLISSRNHLQIIGIDIEKGCLSLDLCMLFPGRRRPSTSSAALFHPSADVLVVPLPCFLATRLRVRLIGAPSALLLGDLVRWAAVDSRSSLLQAEQRKLGSSLARASKSNGSVGILKGVDRLVAACLTQDFSLSGFARMYYSRLTGQDIYQGCQTLYSGIGWGEPEMSAVQLKPVGSQTVLTREGVSDVFGYLAQQCLDLQPGPRASPDSLTNHHAAYVRYCTALISFCLGLRESHVYRLLAQDLISGQNVLTMHDKQGGNRLMALPAKLNPVVVEQVRQYKGHCAALVTRLRRNGEPSHSKLIEALEKALQGYGTLFFFRTERGAIRPAGSLNTWKVLPDHLRVPGNCGRHFWPNIFREFGLGSRDIDRWMRHRVIGTENNTSSQISSPVQSFERICETQLQVLRGLGVGALNG